ncbi:MAG: hypothetical protein CL389_12835 [Acidiferrobacteraceae bacterium]|nr:hypothetical protein [Acidiferrobacteraceae bacterium]
MVIWTSPPLFATIYLVFFDDAPECFTDVTYGFSNSKFEGCCSASAFRRFEFFQASSLAFPTVLLPKTDKSLGFGCAPASLAQSVVSVVVGTGLRPQVAQEPFDHRGASSITARNHIHHHSEGI